MSSFRQWYEDTKERAHYRLVTLRDSIQESSIYMYMQDNYYYSYDEIKEYIRWLLESATLSISFDDLSLILTIFVLFANNIEIITLGKSADLGFVIADSICLFIFIAEFILTTWSKSSVKLEFKPRIAISWSGYIFTFFWYFDIIAIFSLFPDIPFIANPMGIGNVSIDIIRVVRLVRLVRIIRLYRLANIRRRKMLQEQELFYMLEAGEIDFTEFQKLKSLQGERQSKLGTIISQQIIQHVVIIMLVMLIVLPLLMYNVNDHAPSYGLTFIQSINKNPNISYDSKMSIVNEFISVMKSKYSYLDLIQLSIYPLNPDGYIINNKNKLDNLRPDAKEYYEFNYYDPSSGINYSTKAVLDYHPLIALSAEYNIILTIVVAVVLIIGYLMFTKDVTKIVVKPIDRLMNMVEMVAQDPLQPVSITKRKKRNINDNDDMDKFFETKILELSLEKISNLLRIGFGEAGAGIISANLRIDNNKMQSENGEVINALIPGVRVYAIFGFCDIRNFEDINQALGVEVLTFVNTVADIVHSFTHTWGGQCNKNLGNAFLIVWRIGDEETLLSLLKVSSKHFKLGGYDAHKKNNNHAESPGSFSGQVQGRARSSTITRSTIIGGAGESFRPKSVSFGGRNNSIDSTDEILLSPSAKRFSMRRNRSNSGIFPDGFAEGMSRNNSSDGLDNTRVSPTQFSAKRNSGTFLPVSGDGTTANTNHRDDESIAGSSRSDPNKPSKRKHDIDLRKIPGVDKLADAALISFLKIITEINRSRNILRYRNDTRLIRRRRLSHNKFDFSSPIGEDSINFSERKKTNFDFLDRNNNSSDFPFSNPLSPRNNQTNEFRLRMGFGLHAGWAIEGAVGSIHKVDATYLSPHVNIAARLETASRQYGVPLLMSNSFNSILSEVFQKKTRQIDVVKVKGSETPIGIYTYDCYQNQTFLKRTQADIYLYSGRNKQERDRDSKMVDTFSLNSEFSMMNPSFGVNILQNLNNRLLANSKRPSLRQLEKEYEEEFNKSYVMVEPPRRVSLDNSVEVIDSRGSTPANNNERSSSIPNKSPEEFSKGLSILALKDGSANSSFGKRGRRASTGSYASALILRGSIASNATNMTDNSDSSIDNKQKVVGQIPFQNSPNNKVISRENSAEQDKPVKPFATLGFVSEEKIKARSSRRRSSELSTFDFDGLSTSENTPVVSLKKGSEIGIRGSIKIEDLPVLIQNQNENTEVNDTRSPQEVSDIFNTDAIESNSIPFSSSNPVPSNYDEYNTMTSPVSTIVSFGSPNPSPNNYDVSNAMTTPNSTNLYEQPKIKITSIKNLFKEIHDPITPSALSPGENRPQLSNLFNSNYNSSTAQTMPEMSLNRPSLQQLDVQLSPAYSGGSVSPNFGITNQLSIDPVYDTPTMNSHESIAKPSFMTPYDDIQEILERDVDLLMLRSYASPDFYYSFEKGFSNYIQGHNWQRAYFFFSKANSIMMQNTPNGEGDGPCIALMKYIDLYGQAAPRDWKGFRTLTNK